jgi:hypothetical protein
MDSKKIKKLPKPNLTFRIKEPLETEKRKPTRYQGRLLYWVGSLKKMIKVRKQRIVEVEREKTELENEIWKLKKEIQKRTEYQNELKEHLIGLDKELEIYNQFFKEKESEGSLDKKPSFYIKVQRKKDGNEYYVGRVRFFQRNNRKRREKWVYFGSVYELNRKYGKGIEKGDVDRVVRKKLKEELVKMFDGKYF